MKNLDLIANVHPLDVYSVKLKKNTFIVGLEARDAQGNSIGNYRSCFDLKAACRHIMGDYFNEIGVPTYSSCVKLSDELVEWVSSLIKKTKCKGVFCDPNGKYKAIKVD